MEPAQHNPEPPTGRLALHVRRLRQWYGDEGLTQEELAALAAVNERTIREYEGATNLSCFVEPLMRVALALQVPFERLISPHVLDMLREEVEARRRTLATAPDFRDARTEDLE